MVAKFNGLGTGTSPRKGGLNPPASQVKKRPSAPAPMKASPKKATGKPEFVMPIDRELPEGLKIPKTLAECADLVYNTYHERLAAGRVEKALQDKETFLREYIIANLPRAQAEGITGKIGHVERKSKDVPVAEDWTKIHAFIKKTGAFELLNRALNAKAVSERWTAPKAKPIPGVGKFTQVTLSITKRS